MAVGLLALAAPALARAYGWPLEPFNEQHPVRGGFDDPRLHVDEIGVQTASFHFGIDIAAPDDTAVYAVAPGVVTRYADGVVVHQASGHEFWYWHVIPAVATRQRVAEHALLGWIGRGWGHVHLAERVGGVYVNPLRPGALGPYVDTTVPTVAGVTLTTSDALVADIYDTPPLAPPPPWQGARLAPALVGWRIVDVTPWRIAADFRRRLLPPDLFSSVYAPGTWQNKPFRPGRYVFSLAHHLDLPAGTYRVEVAASDLAGNVGTGSAEVTLQSRRSTNRSSAYTRGSRLAGGFSCFVRSTSHCAP
jgi:hypothetical protein